MAKEPCQADFRWLLCFAASTRTLRSVIPCDGVVTTFMAAAGECWCPPRTVA